MQPSPKKEQDLELTRCQAGRIETLSSGTPNHVAGADEMEMTRSYENWEKSITLPPRSKTPRNENDLQVASKVEQVCSLFVALASTWGLTQRDLVGKRCSASSTDYMSPEWTIPQLDKLLNLKTILAQLERAS